MAVNLRGGFLADDATLAAMHGYPAASDGISRDCRIGQHEDCEAPGCVCPCHVVDEPEDDEE